MKRRTPLLVLFFLSGISGLIYELAWVRQASLTFGVSVYGGQEISFIPPQQNGDTLGRSPVCPAPTTPSNRVIPHMKRVFPSVLSP